MKYRLSLCLLFLIVGLMYIDAKPRSNYTISRIVCLGNSLTAGARGDGVTYPLELQQLSGIETVNMGIGGQTSTQIAARFGVAPIKVSAKDGIIPSEGSVEITSKSVNILYDSSHFQGESQGSLCGVEGKMTTDASGNWTFHRSKKGKAVVCPAESVFIPKGKYSKHDFFILWLGRNNYGDTNIVLSDLKACTDKIQRLGCKFIVMTVMNGDNPGEERGGGEYSKIIKLNNLIKAEYPSQYVDIRRSVVDSYNSNDDTDRKYYERDITPPSLRGDAVHLNKTGYRLVAKILYQNMLAQHIISDEQPRYTVENGWITGHNISRYNNRPLYLHNTNAFILTGDKPVCRFAKDEYVYGTFYLSYLQGKEEKPLYEFDDIKSCYRGGQMKWLLKDRAFPKLSITMELIKNASDFGAEIRLSVCGDYSGRLKWTYGGKEKRKGEVMSWSLDVMGHPELLHWGIGEDFVVAETKMIDARKTCYLSVVMNKEYGLTVLEGRKQAFDESLAQLARFNSRLQIVTPDKYLNAMAEASLSAVDGTWYPPVFVHGCMQWNRALPGWRTMFGGIAYGWHNRVLEEAKHYIQYQTVSSNYKEAKADSTHLYTIQSSDSRFYGAGRIQKDQDFYDMQSQFFDQLVEDYNGLIRLSY